MSKLGGHLVGYGIETNGKVEYHWLDKPKHNMIVKSGLEHLLQFGGDPVATYGSFADNTNPNINDVIEEYKKCNLWVGKIDEPRVHHGVLNYCAYGSGDKDTEFTDTDLENRLEMTETRYIGYGYNGNKYVYNNDNIIGIKYRISHKFNAVTDKTIIKELGWFGKAGADAETAQYVLFARIKLDEELVLQQDQSLIVTYELFHDLKISTFPAGMLHASMGGSFVPMAFSNRSDNMWNQIINYHSISENGTPACTTSFVSRSTEFFMLNFPAWYIKVPAIRHGTSTYSIPSKIQLNVLPDISSWGWYWTRDAVYLKETPSKYQNNTFYRIQTVPKNLQIPGSTYYGRNCLYINGICWMINSANSYDYLIGAKKISYTTDVME